MTYFTFIVSEIVNILAICFFIKLGKSNESYKLWENRQPVNHVNAPNINIQAQQVVIINNNNGSSEIANISHQTRGVQKLDKIDKSKFEKKKNENNLNQNKNSNYNINNNNLQLNRIDYPEKEEALNNNIPRKDNQVISRVNKEIRLGYQNNNNNISISNQTIDLKDDNNIAFGSDRLVLK